MWDIWDVKRVAIACSQRVVILNQHFKQIPFAEETICFLIYRNNSDIEKIVLFKGPLNIFCKRFEKDSRAIFDHCLKLYVSFDTPSLKFKPWMDFMVHSVLIHYEHRICTITEKYGQLDFPLFLTCFFTYCWMNVS